MFFSKSLHRSREPLKPWLFSDQQGCATQIFANSRLTRQFYSATDYHSSKKNRIILLPATFEKGEGTAIFLNVGLPSLSRHFC
jgi:hypothetical protein